MDNNTNLVAQSVDWQTLVSSLRAMFSTETFIEQYKVLHYVIDLYMPRYNIAISGDCTRNTIGRSAVSEYMSCTFVDVRLTDNIFTVAGRIYAVIIPPSYGPLVEARPFNPPTEILLMIIFHARVGTRDDLATLRSLALISKAFNMTMQRHRRAIIDHYTVMKERMGTIRYTYCGRPHRLDDLPAVIMEGISEEWYVFGKRHRDNDEPASIYYEDAVREWYKHGKLHRDNDRPAITYEGDNVRHWYQYGKCHRDNDKPAFVSKLSGTQRWYWRGKYHRDNDRPAELHGNGTHTWYWRGKIHRSGDRPAVIYTDGTREWWVHGTHIRTQ